MPPSLLNPFLLSPRWTPRDIPGLRLWLSADAITPQADNTTYTGDWADQSGNSLHGVRTVPGGGTPAGPKYRTAGGPGGGPSLEWTGGNCPYFLFPQLHNPANNQGELHVYLKSQQDGTDPYPSPYDFGQPGNAESHWPFSPSGATNIYESFSIQRFNFVASMAVVNTWRRVRNHSQGGSHQSWLDEVVQASNSSAFGATFNTAPTVGAGRASNTYSRSWRGGISDLYFFDQIVSAPNRVLLLAWRTTYPSGGLP